MRPEYAAADHAAPAPDGAAAPARPGPPRTAARGVGGNSCARARLGGDLRVGAGAAGAEHPLCATADETADPVAGALGVCPVRVCRVSPPRRVPLLGTGRP